MYLTTLLLVLDGKVMWTFKVIVAVKAIPVYMTATAVMASLSCLLKYLLKYLSKSTRFFK